ncbi:hypothetical protein MY4824_002191 [Beauveria thailandica]
MSDQALFSAFGAVLGYIGAEAATTSWFEALLWPQRFFSNFTLRSVPALALLMPMGGPMHKVALEVLDTMFAHGVFKGPREGHMLGTAFFPTLNWTYTMQGDSAKEPHAEQLRNCLWARALRYMPAPLILGPRSTGDSRGHVEKGTTVLDQPHLRANVTVSRVTLSKATPEDKASRLPFVYENNSRPSPRVFLAICVSETTAIAVAIGVFAVYQSFWTVLWLAPLFLRLTSALFALDREPLLSLSSSSADDPCCDFEIHCPQSEGNFMLLTGPPTLVLQFFRHYGHPGSFVQQPGCQPQCSTPGYATSYTWSW